MVEQLMVRIRRESPRLKDSAANAVLDALGESATDMRVWPGSAMVVHAHNRANRIVPDPAPGASGVDKLGDALSYVQRRSYEHQGALDARGKTRGPPAPSLASAKSRANWRKAVSQSRGLAYLYPSGSRAHLAGADFVARSASTAALPGLG